MMKNDIHFELYSRHKGFKVSLAALLQCLRIAEVYGHTAQIDPSWWQSIKSIYPSLEMDTKHITGLDVSKENGCDEHDNFAEFRLTDGKAECHVDMMTLLTTLHVSERAHVIPSMNSTWWMDIVNRYGAIVY